MRRIALLAALILVLGACGDDDAAVTTEAPSPTSATTTAPATTAPTTTTTTTEPAPTGYTVDDLPLAVLQDGDPWVVPVTGVNAMAGGIDDIWPLEGTLVFPDEHAIYEAAGFVDGYFGFFQEPGGSALVLTGAHLFADPAGAAQGLELLSASFSDTDLVAQITGLAPGSLNMVFPMPIPGIGDDGAGVLVSGPQAQVVGFVWVSHNLLQFVRIGMPLGDEDRAAEAVTLARALAARMSG